VLGGNDPKAQGAGRRAQGSRLKAQGSRLKAQGSKGSTDYNNYPQIAQINAD